MIDIPEERILKEITDILMNDLPKVLLELEEQSEDSIRLPPFRYVGLEENLPPGTSLPYAFVEIEEGEYTEKDRIIQVNNYKVKISLKLERIIHFSCYSNRILVLLSSSNKFRAGFYKCYYDKMDITLIIHTESIGYKKKYI
jgi:hypothetical protein